MRSSLPMPVWSYRSLWNLKLDLTKILQTNKGVVSHPVKEQSPARPPLSTHNEKEARKNRNQKSPDWFLCECWLRMVSICVNPLKQWLPVSNSLKPGANHWYLSCKMAHIPRVTLWLLLLSHSGSGLLWEATLLLFLPQKWPGSDFHNCR